MIVNSFSDFYFMMVFLACLTFLVAKMARIGFVAFLAGIWLVFTSSYILLYGTPTFKDYSTIFAAIPLVLGVYMIIDGALGVIYE